MKQSFIDVYDVNVHLYRLSSTSSIWILNDYGLILVDDDIQINLLRVLCCKDVNVPNSVTSLAGIHNIMLPLLVTTE